MRFSTSGRSRSCFDGLESVAARASALAIAAASAGWIGGALTGCGSDDGEPSTVPPAEASGSTDGDGISTEAGQLAPLEPAASPNPNSMSGPIGLVDEDAQNQPAACVDEFASVTQQPPVIQFVVDTSGSMLWVPGTDRAPAAGERSKWQITQEALATAIDKMPDSAAVGINYYPNTSGGGPNCHVPVLAAPIARLTPEHREVIAEVNGAQAPEGGTPTHAAFEFGAEQLAGSVLQGSRFLVLITDGIPTFTLECGGNGTARVDGEPLIAAVEQRFADENIRTFVIGSPGSEEAREELSQMAQLGGTGAPGCADQPGTCHFDMTGLADFSAALNAALGDITEAALGCDFAIPEPPTGRSRINLNDVSVVVESGGNPLREFSRSSSAECDSGWQYDDQQTTLSLCRSTCDELNQLVREDPGVSIRVRFGCSIVPS